MHAASGARAGEASLADLLLLLEREPELNAHQRAMCGRNRSVPSGGLALIRCDGGGKFGYGHVKRMVALARALRDREGIGVHVRAERHAKTPPRPSAAPALKR